jgi:hypothetical protein
MVMDREKNLHFIKKKKNLTMICTYQSQSSCGFPNNNILSSSLAKNYKVKFPSPPPSSKEKGHNYY